MSQIEFDEEPIYSSTRRPVQHSFLIGLVLKTGLVRTKKQAELVLLAVAILFGFLAFIAPSLILGDVEVTSEDKNGAFAIPINTSALNSAE